jgi:plasmid maintenance system killer protein
VDIIFVDDGLERMDRDADFHGEFEASVADEFRHRLQILRSADCEQRLLLLKALDMHRLAGGNTSYLMRVTDRFCLELEFRDGEDRSDRCVIVAGMTPQSNDNRGSPS